MVRYGPHYWKPRKKQKTGKKKFGGGAARRDAVKK
jgi:hypothetical protein